MDIANNAINVWDRVRDLCKERNISQKRLSEDTGISASKIARKTPHGADASELIILSDYFGVTVDYLLGRSSDFEITCYHDAARALFALDRFINFKSEYKQSENSESLSLTIEQSILASSLNTYFSSKKMPAGYDPFNNSLLNQLRKKNHEKQLDIIRAGVIAKLSEEDKKRELLLEDNMNDNFEFE